MTGACNNHNDAFPFVLSFASFCAVHRFRRARSALSCDLPLFVPLPMPSFLWALPILSALGGIGWRGSVLPWGRGRGGGGGGGGGVGSGGREDQKTFPEEENGIYQRSPKLEVEFKYTNLFLAPDLPLPRRSATTPWPALERVCTARTNGTFIGCAAEGQRRRESHPPQCSIHPDRQHTDRQTTKQISADICSFAISQRRLVVLLPSGIDTGT